MSLIILMVNPEISKKTKEIKEKIAIRITSLKL